MNLQKFDFPLPEREEIEAILDLAKSNPEDLDGRELWVLEEVLGGEEE